METERLFIITEKLRNRELLGLPVAAVTVWPALPAFPVVINIEGLSRTPIFTLFDTLFLLSYAIFLFRFFLLKSAMVLLYFTLFKVVGNIAFNVVPDAAAMEMQSP